MSQQQSARRLLCVALLLGSLSASRATRLLVRGGPPPYLPLSAHRCAMRAGAPRLQLPLLPPTTAAANRGPLAAANRCPPAAPFLLQWNITGPFVNFPFAAPYPVYVARNEDGSAPDRIVLVTDSQDGGRWTLSALEADTGGACGLRRLWKFRSRGGGRGVRWRFSCTVAPPELQSKPTSEAMRRQQLLPPPTSPPRLLTTPLPAPACRRIRVELHADGAGRQHPVRADQRRAALAADGQRDDGQRPAVCAAGGLRGGCERLLRGHPLAARHLQPEHAQDHRLQVGRGVQGWRSKDRGCTMQHARRCRKSPISQAAHHF